MRAAFFSLARRLLGAGLLGLGMGAMAQTPAVVTWTAEADARNLDAEPGWQALLHLKHGTPQIPDPAFLLSHTAFSPRAELHATLAALDGPDGAQMVCRFPARYLWLRQALALPALPLDACPQWAELQRQAPAERISLVFASENLAQPSSMMGHLFLKVDGRRENGAEVSHAIAFFTDTATLNLPKLLFDSIVVGKPGYFVLKPYQEEAQQYALTEQRSLWEYSLQLDATQRRLLQAHLLELRPAHITYFFHRYNCATLVRHILGVAHPAILQDDDAPLSTPRSVVRQAHEAGLVASSTVITPARWQVRALGDSLPPEVTERVRQAVEARDTDLGLAPVGTGQDADTPAFLALSLARAYNTYLIGTQRVAAGPAQAYGQALARQQAERHPGMALELGEDKNPAQAPREGQLSLGWRVQGRTHQWRLGLMPVSHTLVDDNRRLMSESALRLFDSAWLVDADSGRVRLDHFTLYAVESYLPHDPLTGGWSGRFRIAVAAQDQLRHPDARAPLIEGAAGKTLRLAPDVDAHALLGAGWGWRHGGYAYLQPQVGLIVREVWDMKTVLTWRRTTRPLGEALPGRALELSQAKVLGPRQSLVLGWQRTWQQGRSADQGQLVFKQLF
ncbi:DUF4105 domain-containing protein [Aquabacterium sp.]|uniref:Lnb N-terminal periplasmic domain-containing protein n=1 Tax=Aquabacterium sp. TaxID=1872578 RepID=UPI0025B875DF|nr:DUF4105 domain-containing protein [Aquabacterium sp.]